MSDGHNFQRINEASCLADDALKDALGEVLGNHLWNLRQFTEVDNCIVTRQANTTHVVIPPGLIESEQCQYIVIGCRKTIEMLKEVRLKIR